MKNTNQTSRQTSKLRFSYMNLRKIIFKTQEIETPDVDYLNLYLQQEQQQSETQPLIQQLSQMTKRARTMKNRNQNHHTGWHWFWLVLQ